ncbi:MAG: glycosyltransferase family 2 protein [Nanoarchaeota archaeon]|nr:glycosyltransferase family 2 protein [Nanoarchaeota archaeon]
MVSSKKVVDYSVIVPMYNEEGNIKKLDKEIKAVMSKVGDYELIYVNDGSKDRTLKELGELKGVTIVNLNRNYGQSIALDAGFKAAQGEIIVSLDGDGQNDPADIPKLIEQLNKENLDVVAGWRKNRMDKNGIKILTKTGRFARRILIKDDVHDTGCTLRVYRKEAAKSLDLQGEMHRYILALLRWKGFKIGEIEVNHRPRLNGESKYGYQKAVKGFIDLIHIWFIDKYSQRPLHMFGFLGLSCFLLGVLAELWMAFQKIFYGIDLSANAWFPLGFFLMLGGIMFFSFGLIIDLTIKAYLNTSHNESRYYVRDMIRK